MKRAGKKTAKPLAEDSAKAQPGPLARTEAAHLRWFDG
jgi:hypothetical protein